MVRGQQIGKITNVAQDHVAHANTNGLPKDRAIENERVILTIFAARIHAGGQVMNELAIECAAGERLPEFLGIHAGEIRLEAQVQERLH